MSDHHTFTFSRSEWSSLLYATLFAMDIERQLPGKPGLRLLEHMDLVEELQQAAVDGYRFGEATLSREGLAAAVTACSSAQILSMTTPQLNDRSILDRLEEMVGRSWALAEAAPRLPGTVGVDRLERFRADLTALEAVLMPAHFRSDRQA